MLSGGGVLSAETLRVSPNCAFVFVFFFFFKSDSKELDLFTERVEQHLSVDATCALGLYFEKGGKCACTL